MRGGGGGEGGKERMCWVTKVIVFEGCGAYIHTWVRSARGQRAYIPAKSRIRGVINVL